MERGELLAEGRTAEVFACGDGRILKLIRPEMPPGLADVEARAARAAEAALLPVPRLLDTVILDGRPGLVYERIEGPSMLAVLGSQPSSVGSLARTFAVLHCRMHDATNDSIPELHAQLIRAIQAAPLPQSLVAAALDRLRALPAGNAVLHGDMHPGNVIMSNSGPRIIDWMTVCRGDPSADVARTLFLLRDGEAPGLGVKQRLGLAVLRRIFVRRYLAEYRRHRELSEDAIRAWRPVLLAARLSEGIEPERKRLTAEIGRALPG